MGDDKSLDHKKKLERWVIAILVVLIVLSFLVILGMAVLASLSFIGCCCQNFNWMHLVYGSMVTILLVLLVIFWSNLIARILSFSDGE